MPNLKEVIISITNRCNFKCRMCDIPKNRINELPALQWKKVIKNAASCGAQTVVFSGGEPLIREDIFELISFVKNESMAACLTSNGYLINDWTADKLRQAGIDVVNVSIEGPKRIHDYLRGKGMFEKAIAALGNLRRYKIESTIAATVSRYNYKYLTHIVGIARKYGATTIKFQPFSEIFLNNRQDSKDFLISDAEAMKLAQIMQEIIRISKDYAVATSPRSYLEMIPFYLARKYFDAGNGCAALDSSCPINCNGDIYPCWVLADNGTLISNVKEDSFSNIWNSRRRSLIIAKIKKEGCPGCMMSCYDNNFAKDTVEQKIAFNLKRLQNKGVREYTRSIFKKWTRRLKFYSSYRGSFRQILARFKGALLRERAPKAALNQEEISSILKEIEAVKQILIEELQHSR
jgi:radical SAM protein with 4Fe4S-binding SPASM domain